MTTSDAEQLRAWALRERRLWIFLDYDGTLAEFAEHPGIIEHNPRVTDVLGRMLRRYGGNLRLAVVSGRRLADLRQLLPLEGIFLGGVYGLEIATPDGRNIRRVELGDVRPTLERIRALWEKLISGRQGFYLEDKTIAVALHARWAEASEAQTVLAGARQMFLQAEADSRIKLHEAHRFVEAAPARAEKGDAVALLLQQYPLQDAKPLYVGDDDRDERTFPVIHEAGGMAARVIQSSQASRATSADFRLRSPAETLWVLEALA